MLSLNRNEKVTCENCGTSVTKKNLSRHKLRCHIGKLYCWKSPNFSTKSRDDFNYHFAKKHIVPRPSITYKCKLCHAEFTGFMLYVNLKTLNIEYKLDSERATLRWRTQWEMLVIKVREKNWNLANTFWQTLKWRRGHTEYSTLPSHPSIRLYSTINWIMYSRNWNVLQKLTLHWIRSQKRWRWIV